MSTAKTRTSAATWLIGGAADRIVCNRLPTLRNILQYVLYLRQARPWDSIRDTCREVVEEVLVIWGRGGIPTLSKNDATDKLVAVFKEWIELKRSMSRPANLRRLKFEASLDLLFDIGLRQGKIELEEDRLFYESMKKDRTASMLRVDRSWVKKKEKKQKREEGQRKLKERSDKDISAILKTASSDLCPGPDDEPQRKNHEEKDLDYIPPKNKRLKILTKRVTAALDRAQCSDAFGAHIVKQTVESTLNAAAETLGCDEIATLRPVYSRASLQRDRKQNRVMTAESLQTAAQSMQGPFLVHWDGKILPEGTPGADIKKYDRLPVLVTALDYEQLLGVPRLESSTGRAQAEATFELLCNWGLQNKIAGTVFDTTSTNTGHIKGCCTLLAEKIANELIHCACRHHVAELVLEAVTIDLLGDSKDPRLPFFEKLDSSWNTLDKGNYRTAALARKLKLIPESDDIISFCKRQLEVKQPRGDYRELLELCILFLGGQVNGKHQYVFKKPGALSKTRWMARAIYALKTWMFGRQTQLTKEKDSQLLALCIFVCRAYVRYWFKAPIASECPRNDLEFLQLLYASRKLGSHWKAALQKFSHHLWYLSPKLLCFALFDDEVSYDEKAAIALAIRRGKFTNDTMMRAEVELTRQVSTLRLRDFATRDSLKFFAATRIEKSVLSKDPTAWKNDEGYTKGKEIVTGFKVVNDCAERGVQLVTRFLKGNKLTNDEEQRQFLLLAVTEDRKLNKLK